VYIYIYIVIPETSRLVVRPIQWVVDAHVGKAAGAWSYNFSPPRAEVKNAWGSYENDVSIVTGYTYVLVPVLVIRRTAVLTYTGTVLQLEVHYNSNNIRIY